ncbi:unnamed protein product [Brassicogethes aeneus]|uniref:tRNA (carboxymethyluridine(34)-5-O)-methyltransferase n=1 Tax=Brassicogethes aeneus TaxID=1431903 RepID=A0A9P0BDX7_BRAAE|nr:unnamed protein product [Brassicogethes aeneus]
METMSQIKKIERKVKKLQHVVLKETGVTCVAHPTKILAICNAGLVNGLTEEIIVENFKKYGNVNKVCLVPGKSCSFVSYRDLESATMAYNCFNGKLNIAQENKPVYLSFVENLVDFEEEKSWSILPEGLVVLEDFISEKDEETLLELCNFDESCGSMKNRQVKHYGYEFRYDINNVDKDKPLKEKIPMECDFLWTKLNETYFKGFVPNQLTINHYMPGQGIPHHIDTHSAFEDPIMSLSLNSSVIMDFKCDKKHFCVFLPRRSLAIMSGEARYNWTHGITPRKFDVIKSQIGFNTLQRETRVSFTFRRVLQGNCTCRYPFKCDSYAKNNEDKCIEEKVAADLEKTHVHDVYENIANHFSDTRHKPWPNVLEFVQGFQLGSLLVDVGCGNGKYLGHNKNIYEMGCDTSLGLLEVCKNRNFNIFNANCLNIPLKNNIADACISIAVIHHLANDERRLMALKEMARVLTVGGRCLIYVWAKDQKKDNEKSSYIKQDRKNRKAENIEINKNEEEITISENIKLPVHTNRTQFKHKDVLVPWKLKSTEENKQTFLREVVWAEKAVEIRPLETSMHSVFLDFGDFKHRFVAAKARVSLR